MKIISNKEKHEYGYTYDGMVAIDRQLAIYIHEGGEQEVFILNYDGSETLMEDLKDIHEHDGLFGVEIGEGKHG